MMRDLTRLGSTTFDLVIIGGGAYGVATAWDATSRGLCVALLERGDFGHATSAQSLKVVHGGLRYLQNLDIRRIRASDGERKALMRIAPHLVHVLPVLLPTRRIGIQCRPIIAAALAVHELLSCDRNIGLLDQGKKIPLARLISKEDCLGLAPGLPTSGLTGGAVYYDGQMYNSERLTLAFVRSAATHGACVANYVEASAFLRRGDRIQGVVATDLLTGQKIDVTAKAVLNAAGPWLDQVMRAPGGIEGTRPTVPFVKTINLVTRPLTDSHAIALTVPRRDAHGEAIGSGRLIYMAPWRGRSIIGSAHFKNEGSADACAANDREIQTFLGDINAAYPLADLTPDDVLMVRCGLVPAAEARGTNPYNTSHHHRIIDHASEGAEGLFSMVGVKWTTARNVAETAVTLAAKKLAVPVRRPRSARTPLFGGDIADFDTFLNDVFRQRPHQLSQESLDQLARNHGSDYRAVVDLAQCRRNLAAPVSRYSPVFGAQIVYAIRNEMALTLDDIVLRRTELATAGHPGRDVLENVASLMALERGWDEQTTAHELEATELSLSRAHAKPQGHANELDCPNMKIEAP